MINRAIRNWYICEKPDNRLESFLQIRADDVVAGELITVEATVPGDASGVVAISIVNPNNQTSICSYSGSVSGGNLTLIIRDYIPPRSYNIVGYYEGDSVYKPCSTTYSNYTVEEYPIDEDDVKMIDQGNGECIVMVPFPASINSLNDVGSLSAIVNGNTYVGTRTLYDNAVLYTFDFSNLSSGTYDVSIYYSGDNMYYSSWSFTDWRTVDI